MNWLADDMDALQQFLSLCAQAPIATKSKELNLWGNDLEALPPAITQLQGLERLNAQHNNLSDAIVAQVSQLTSLRYLHLGGNNIEKLDPKLLLYKN